MSGLETQEATLGPKLMKPYLLKIQLSGTLSGEPQPSMTIQQKLTISWKLQVPLTYSLLLTPWEQLNTLLFCLNCLSTMTRSGLDSCWRHLCSWEMLSILLLH